MAYIYLVFTSYGSLTGYLLVRLRKRLQKATSRFVTRRR